jgi:PqqD family protein of HPr-rel-A system
MMVCCAKVDRLVTTPAGCALRWHEWDEVYIVYQPSSTETHVFNETTALILRSLEQGPMPAHKVREWTEAALGVALGELGSDDFSFATQRLVELGLIEWFDEALATQ